MYSRLLDLSRNIFFYEKVHLKDNFETRIYLMFFHFSIIMLIFKRKQKKFDQDNYDHLFHAIENDLRELGFGDVSVNKKMREFNKILYDILLKIDLSQNFTEKFSINKKLIIKYFANLKIINDENFTLLYSYFSSFFEFCYELSHDNMIENIKNFKF